MHDNDSFRLIDPDAAVGLAAVIVVALGLSGAFVEEPVLKRTTAPKPRCDVTVAQYGPSERWAPHPRQPACAKATHDIPNHILTIPVEAK